MLNEIADAMPNDVPDALKASTGEVASGFAQACMDDPLFEFGLLAMTFMPPDSTWRSGEPWGARHWSAKQRVVRPADVPRRLPLGQMAAARPDHAGWNAAYWLVGLKPDRSGVVLRAHTEWIDNPMQPLEDPAWAMQRLAGFAGDLASGPSD